MASTEAAEDTSFEQMVEYQQQVADIIAKNPYVAAYQSSAAAADPAAVRQYRTRVHTAD